MNPIHIQGDLLWPDGAIRPGRLTLQGGQIQSIESLPGLEALPESLQVPPGGVAAPGFIDLQVNGAFGHDFTREPESITIVAEGLPRYGVTSFLPTIISAPAEDYRAAIDFLKQAGGRSGRQSAHVLGLHFEGPFLNPSRKGAHPAEHLRLPVQADLAWIDPTYVRLVTLAPELPGALDFIRQLVTLGIHVGLGHSQATFDETLAALKAGASWSTHLFNAMLPLHHRQPGIAGALLTDPRAVVALIPDSVHLHPAILKLVAALKGPAGITLISDAMAAAGMPAGEYRLGGQRVFVEPPSARLKDGTLAGSISMLDQAVRNMVQLAGTPLNQALQMASQTPAVAAGAGKKGQLAPGWDADLVILDQDMQVMITIIAGEIAYQA